MPYYLDDDEDFRRRHNIPPRDEEEGERRKKEEERRAKNYHPERKKNYLTATNLKPIPKGQPGNQTQDLAKISASAKRQWREDKGSLPLNFGEEEKKAFLKAFGETMNIRESLSMIGFPRTSDHVNYARKSDREFNKKFRQVRLQNVDKLKAEAVRRAYHGVDSPVWHRGKIVGYEKVYSDSMLMRLIEANDDRYKRSGHQVNVGVATGAAKEIKVYLTNFEDKDNKKAVPLKYKSIENQTVEEEEKQMTPEEIDEDSYSI